MPGIICPVVKYAPTAAIKPIIANLPLSCSATIFSFSTGLNLVILKKQLLTNVTYNLQNVIKIEIIQQIPLLMSISVTLMYTSMLTNLISSIKTLICSRLKLFDSYFLLAWGR